MVDYGPQKHVDWQEIALEDERLKALRQEEHALDRLVESITKLGRSIDNYQTNLVGSGISTPSVHESTSTDRNQRSYNVSLAARSSAPPDKR